MTIHFSAAQSNLAGQAVRSVLSCMPLRPANDNGPEPANDVLLRQALLHFGKHGLGAPRLAADRAIEACEAGDEERTRHWLGVCRLLDRRLATRTAKRLGLAG